jgi:putative ABC transport system permease protein
MIITELVKTSVRGIYGNKMRSFLTMLGIIIGVGSVITMLSLGEGAKKQVISSIQELGTNLLFVNPNYRRSAVRTGRVQTLTVEDAENIKKYINEAEDVAPESSSNFQVKFYNKNVNTSVEGVTPNFPAVRNYNIKSGHFFNNSDMRMLKRVCVIGKTAQTELFEQMNPIGRIIKIKGINFEIIGTLEEKGQSGWRDNDDLIFVPLTTYQKRLAGNDYIESINVKIKDEKLMDQAEKKISELMRRLHNLRPKDEDDFRIRSQAEFIERMNEVTNTFTYLLAGVATVSLLVGGIGIMNIMLVSVTERTKEIGIRKAIGAKKKHILLQFLLESVIVSLTGGIIGIGLGYLLSDIASNFAEFETVITYKSILLSFLFSISVGLFFGIYPANKAAKLKPIEALRYE